MTGQNANFHKKPCQVKNTVYGIFFELNSYDYFIAMGYEKGTRKWQKK